jgi:hypothetical protein
MDSEKAKGIGCLVILGVCLLFAIPPIMCVNKITEPLTPEQRQKLDADLQAITDANNAKRVITQDEYAQLTIGMTKDQIDQIVGDPGKAEHIDPVKGAAFSYRNFDGMGAVLYFGSKVNPNGNPPMLLVLTHKEQMKFFDK